MENQKNLTANNDEQVIIPPKKKGYKKWLSKKWLWIVVVIFIVGIAGVVFAISQRQNNTEYETEIVKKGDLKQTVSATGQVESAKNIKLNFKTSGRISFLSVKQGDKVEAGKLLARLDSAGLSAQVRQYRASLASAEAELLKIKAGASEEDISVSKQQVEKARRDLESLIVKQNQELSTLRQKAVDSAINGSFVAQVALDVVYNHLINDNTTTYLIVKDNQAISNLKADYVVLSQNYNNLKPTITKLNNSPTNDEILNTVLQLNKFMNDFNVFLNDAYSVADGIVVNSSYSQSDIDAIKTDINTKQSAVNTALTTSQTNRSNLINSINSYQSQIEAAEDNLAIYQAQLNLKQADPRNFEISSAEAKVAQANAQLSKALADLSDNSIYSPIDGTIVKVNYEVGEQTSLSQPVLELLTDEQYEIEVNIPESDIAKIEIGDNTTIELDAFGSDHIFTGVVSIISPAQTVISDVTYYEITVSFNNDDWNEKIKPGMTADVTIETATAKDVLYIPQRAVKIKETVLGQTAKKYVEILNQNNTVEEKEVSTGLRADGGLVEIISGLNEGETVITFKRNGS